MEKKSQLENTVKNRQKGPVLMNSALFYSFINSFNRTAKIFIQRIYSFKKSDSSFNEFIHSKKSDYSFNKSIIFSEKSVSATPTWDH